MLRVLLILSNTKKLKQYFLKKVWITFVRKFSDFATDKFIIYNFKISPQKRLLELFLFLFFCISFPQYYQ